MYGTLLEEQTVVLQVGGQVVKIPLFLHFDPILLDIVPHNESEELCLALAIVGLAGLTTTKMNYVLDEVTLDHNLILTEVV